jgi:hypothetical protein
MQSSPIKSPPPSYGSVFFLKRKHYYAFIAKKCKKHIFSNGFSIKNSKIWNGPKFHWCISMPFTTKKCQQKIPTIIVVFKYICNFSYYVTSIISSHTYSIHSSSSRFFLKNWLI